MYTDPFYLLQSVLNAHPENWYATDEPSVQRWERCIYSHCVKYVHFHIVVNTGGGTEVQVRDQKTLMNSNIFFRSYLTADTGS